MEWKDSPVFSDRYEVSSTGLVRSKEYVKHTANLGGAISYKVMPKLLRSSLDGNGYPQVMLQKDKIPKTVKIHILVAKLFVEGYSKDLQVNHKDGDKLNASAKNLEWVTGKQNVIHSYETGLASNKGSRHPRSVLTEEIVIECRKLRANGTTVRELSAAFGIKACTLYSALSGKNWGHC